ncbi:virulence RhuM family protein [uncultured Methanobrevibacter sp.]|uniref:virulence RhuM family protein n=1 Tax=uncultured Methanobrevibacter sp. TaxID=253161 RepID=UPI0025D1AC5D|nr:virulence RhuM family protein [uncultured Methanobrevibacter sp.]MEE3490572.1 virulence RhuM family protein [Methanobrevibacter sp.]
MTEENEIQRTLLYIGDEGEVSMDVIVDPKMETFWATQKTMAEVFNVKVPAISKHLKNIFEEGELQKNSVVSKMEITASDGKKYNTNFYNLDAIISVGYRVNSKNATHFRIWATKQLKELIIKGFVLDDELLKNGSRFGIDYFTQLLERVRDIRSSERRFNQKITDIYATSFDYNKDAQLTREFFATVQNKLIYAVSGHTAAEIIAERSDSEKTNMGLTNWSNPNGKIILSDVVISKNYLNEKELKRLNSLVDGFLTLAEARALNEIPMSMGDWKQVLDDYINLNLLPILEGKGKISSNDAKKIAKDEYDKFKVIQDKHYQSDFDKLIIDIKRVEGVN